MTAESPFAHNIDEASSFNLDLDKLHRQRLVVQGASGAGKSGAIRRLIECAYDRFQVVVIDPEDEYASLRTLFPAVIGSAAPGGDFLLSPKMGRNLASGILRAGIHAVLQVGEMTWDEQREFTGAFIEGLLGAPRDLWRPLLVVVDEAQRFAPQGTEVASSEAMRALATTGRKRGYTGVFAVQRLSQFSKDVLGQCQNRLMGRADQRLDQKATADVLGFPMGSTDAKELTSLESRFFWGHGPAISRTPVMLEICETTTECESEAGADAPPPPAELADAIRALATIKEPEPEKKPDHSGGANKMVDPDQLRMARDAGYREGHDDGYQSGFADGVAVFADRIVEEGRKVEAELASGNYSRAEPQEAPPRPRDVHLSSLNRDRENEHAIVQSETTGGELSPSAMRVLDVLAHAYPRRLTYAQAAKRAGISKRSSAFRSYQKEIIKAGLGQEVDGHLIPAPGVRPSGPVPSTLDDWASKLPPSIGRMLFAIRDIGPADKASVAEAAGVSPTSSGLGSGLKELADLGLIENQSGVFSIHPDVRHQ